MKMRIICIVTVGLTLAACTSLPHKACRLGLDEYALLDSPPRNRGEILRDLEISGVPVEGRTGHTESWFSDSRGELAVCNYAKAGCDYYSIVVFVSECQNERSECIQESICLR